MTVLGKPFRAEVKLRNNRLIRARELAGYLTQAEAAQAAGIDTTTMCAFEGLKSSPWNTKTGDWKASAIKLALLYKVPAEELWPDVVRRVERTSTVLEFDAPEGFGLPDAVDPGDRMDVRAALEALPEFERDVVVSHQLDGDELHVIGERYGLSRERIRQVEARGLLLLRKQLERGTE